MKKLFLTLSVAGMLCLGTANVFAQEAAEAANAEAPATEQVAEEAPAAEEAAPAIDAETEIEGESMHQVLKQKFIEGSWMWMLLPLLCLILGLAVCLERILVLSFSSTNTKKFEAKVEDALNNGGIEAAKDVCRNTRGPVASIYYQGLDRYDQGLDVVEKSVASYGSVQMGLMESGLTWISLFIALSVFRLIGKPIERIHKIKSLFVGEKCYRAFSERHIFL